MARENKLVPIESTKNKILKQLHSPAYKVKWLRDLEETFSR